jgi:hypothetical protein
MRAKVRVFSPKTLASAWKAGLALCAVLLGEEVEGALDAQGLAVHLELERGLVSSKSLFQARRRRRGVVQEPLELVESW